MAVIASLVLLVHAAQAQDEPRWALVIGNKDYRHVPSLTTPVNDARAVAGALKELGFTVLRHENLDRAGMYDAVDTFADRILSGVALVYYAGHGVRIGSTNYLLPIDNRARSERDVENDALPLDRVLRQLAGARAKLVVVFVDACRDNPLPPAPTRGGLALPGLAPPVTPGGTMVVFSAGENQRALDRLPGDDPSSNGLFARELLRELRRPGMSLDQAVKNARNRVREEARSVGHVQNPAIYDELEGGEFYLGPPPVPEPEPAPAPAADFDPRQLDLEFWAGVKDSRDPENFQAYLERFPKGIYAHLARSRLEDLNVDQSPTEELKERTTTALPPAKNPEPLLVPALSSPAKVEATLGLDPEDWRRLQGALTALGFDTRGTDGNPGRNTHQAIAAWQAHKGQEVTSYLSEQQKDLVLAEAKAILEAPSPSPQAKGSQQFGNEALVWAKVLEGEYYSQEYRYGFLIEGFIGTATVSNSPMYRPGDIILRYVMTAPNTFKGEQICTDGGFYPVTGTLFSDKTLAMTIKGCGPRSSTQWRMVRVRDIAG